MSVKTANQIADTIAEQMGGLRRLKMMLGAEVYAKPNGLAFKWPARQRSRGNYVEITLQPSDTYNMEFFNASRAGKKSVKIFRDIYNDQLVDAFEKQTGWYLKMGSTLKRAVLRIAQESPEFKEALRAELRKSASSQIDLQGLKDMPYFIPEWDADAGYITMYMGDNFGHMSADYILAKTPKEMIDWCDKITKRVALAKAKLQKIETDQQKVPTSTPEKPTTPEKAVDPQTGLLVRELEILKDYVPKPPPATLLSKIKGLEVGKFVKFWGIAYLRGTKGPIAYHIGIRRKDNTHGYVGIFVPWWNAKNEARGMALRYQGNFPWQQATPWDIHHIEKLLRTLETNWKKYVGSQR
jgi:hypothetical protein